MTRGLEQSRMAPLVATLWLGMFAAGGMQLQAEGFVLLPSTAVLAQCRSPRPSHRTCAASHGPCQPSGVRFLKDGIAGTWERWGDDGDVSAWRADNGIWCPWSVVNLGADRTVVATDPYKPGDIICRVPQRAAWEVSGSEAPAVPAGFISPSYWNSADAAADKTGWCVKLAAKLLYEHSLGSASLWAPYITALPTSVDTLIHWSRDELGQLQNPRLARQVRPPCPLFGSHPCDVCQPCSSLLSPEAFG